MTIRGLNPNVVTFLVKKHQIQQTRKTLSGYVTTVLYKRNIHMNVTLKIKVAAQCLSALLKHVQKSDEIWIKYTHLENTTLNPQPFT